MGFLLPHIAHAKDYREMIIYRTTPAYLECGSQIIFNHFHLTYRPSHLEKTSQYIDPFKVRF
jgi:hypothetical protein